MLALAAVACSTAPRECRPVSLTEVAARDLEAHAAVLDFTPTIPCAFRSNVRVTGVYLDTLPGDPPRPRISIEVTGGGGRIYLLSQTRFEVRSFAIPLGSHHFGVVLEDAATIEATGFAGPAGTGEQIAYLRWRRDGVTTELFATLSPGFTEDDVERVARALMATPP